MRVDATIPEYGVTIRGELEARFTHDGGAVIGRIPALKLTVQGQDEAQAQELLRRLFAEFFKVAIETEPILETLVSYRFRIHPDPDPSGDVRGTKNYLKIIQISVPDHERESALEIEALDGLPA